MARGIEEILQFFGCVIREVQGRALWYLGRGVPCLRFCPEVASRAFLERPPARQQFIEDNSKAENVTPTIDAMSSPGLVTGS